MRSLTGEQGIPKSNQSPLGTYMVAANHRFTLLVRNTSVIELSMFGGSRLLQDKEIYSRIFEAVAAARLQVG